MALSKNKNTKESIIAAILLFLFIPPYFVWGIMDVKLIKISLELYLCFLFLKHRKVYTHKDWSLSILFIFTIAYVILLDIIHEQSNINGIIARCVPFFFVTIPFAQKAFMNKVYKWFVSIYVIIIGLSLLSWVGAQIGVLPSIGQILLTGQNRIYTVYPLLVIDYGSDFIRFYGPFNEPGVVGTLGVILLCIQRFNFKDWRTVIILISGILSMSFFFYFLVIGFGIVYLFFVKKKIVIAALFVVLLFFSYNYTKNVPIIYTTLWERFEWDSSKKQFKGDNRKKENVDTFYDSLKETPDYYFGSSGEQVNKFWSDVTETSSYKVVVVSSGIIFLILYLLFFVLMAKNYSVSTKWFLLFTFVLLLNTYQRPDVYSILMIFIYSYFARYNKKIISNPINSNTTPRSHQEYSKLYQHDLRSNN